MRLATKSDFINGPIFTRYRHHDGFAKRAQLLSRYPEPYLVVGCAFGFLLYEFDKIGKQSYGLEASPEIFEEGWPDDLVVHSRVVRGSILDETDIKRLLRYRFGAVFTEDLLPYLTDKEASEAAANCAVLSPVVVHLVTERGGADLNFHSVEEWIAITGQTTLSLEGM